MIHPDTQLQLISPAIGYGVVATAFIPKGTIVWCQDELDQVLSPQRVSSLSEPCKAMIEKYAFRDRTGNHILCWDNSRFVNHSFRPNCLPTPYDFELAVRDIKPGEELLDDYGTLNLTTPFRALPEAGVRRRVAYPHDLQRHHRRWDRQLKDAFGSFLDVSQPLWDLVPVAVRPRVIDVAQGRADMDSCLETWCPPATEAAELAAC